jgi:hypothetical protein
VFHNQICLYQMNIGNLILSTPYFIK